MTDLPLFDPDRPIPPQSRASDPETSRMAAARIAPMVASHEFLVLQAHVDAGADGLTGEELAQATGIAYETIGPRRPALKRRGWVEVRLDDAGKVIKRTNVKGSKCEVWFITAEGLRAYLRATREAA